MRALVLLLTIYEFNVHNADWRWWTAAIIVYSLSITLALQKEYEEKKDAKRV